MVLLPPISEHPRVSFVSRKGDRSSNGDHSSYSDSFCSQTSDSDDSFDVVEVRFIPALSAYSTGDKHALWYTSADVRAMKQAAFRDIDRRKEELRYNTGGSRKQHHPNGGSGGYACDIRGLERLVYEGDHHDCLRRRYECLRSVLREQHYQREQQQQQQRRRQHDCHQDGVDDIVLLVHQDRDSCSCSHPTGGGADRIQNDNDERIREVCMATGNTIKSQEKARQLALEDGADVREYLQQQQQQSQSQQQPRDGGRTETASTANRQPQQPPPAPHAAMLSPITGRTPPQPRKGMAAMPSSSSSKGSNNNCCWCFEVAHVVGRSLLFHSLLRPFLQLHPGDAFLEPPPP